MFIFGEELAYIFSSAYHNDNGGAGDAYKEQDFKKSHAKDEQSHRDRLYRERRVDEPPTDGW
jgi:hypothetical protein